MSDSHCLYLIFGAVLVLAIVAFGSFDNAERVRMQKAPVQTGQSYTE